MCLLFPVHNLLPLFSVFIALWLSCNKMLYLISYPCASMNKNPYAIGLVINYSGYFGFSGFFCVQFLITGLLMYRPISNDIIPSVWLFGSGYTPYA